MDFGVSQVVLEVRTHLPMQIRSKRHGFDPKIGKIPWRRTQQPTSVFLPGGFHGQRVQKCSGLCSRRVEYCPYNQTCFMQNEKKSLLCHTDSVSQPEIRGLALGVFRG